MLGFEHDPGRGRQQNESGGAFAPPPS